MKRVMDNRVWYFTLVAATALATCVGAIPAFARSTANDGIAMSSANAMNSWRQQMMRIWTQTADQAVKDGVIAKTKVVDANGSVAQQESQLEGLVLQGWKAIAILAASTTALNGAVERACRAGVVVVSFNGLVTAPCAYKVANNVTELGKEQAEFVAKALHGKGNVLAVRGIAGNSWDSDNFAGVKEGFKNYPNIKIVATVRGDWTQSVAQKAVAGILPSLPPIQAVVTQGGDGAGTYQAFKDSGRKIPMIVFGNRYRELALWSKLEKRPGGYYTFSLSSASGVSSIAFWVAQAVLAGEDVPKNITVPPLVIYQNDLHGWLSVTKPGNVATPVYSKQWVHALIKANLDHTKLPASPPPARAP